MRFWPATDPAQLDYEQLRALALAGPLAHETQNVREHSSDVVFGSDAL